MRLDPERKPITRPVFVWLEMAAQLSGHGDWSLAAVIRLTMDGRLAIDEHDPDRGSR